MTGDADPAAVVLGRCRAAAALLTGPAGPCSGRLLCVDGPAGSGKTTLAAAVADRAPGAVRVLHLDDLYEGWSGLGDVAQRLRDRVVAPLAGGGAGRFRRWDWPTARWAEEHTVDPVDLLVLEGVGSGTPLLAPWRSLLVWIDAPHAVRMRRGLERDGPELGRFWDDWAASEAEVFARDGTEAAADVVVDGAGGHRPRPA